MSLQAIEKQLKAVRAELKNLRQQIFGLRQSHRKDIEKVKSLLQDKSSETNVSNSHSTKKNNREKDAFCWSPIGVLESSCFETKNGTPRQPSLCSESAAVIRITSCGDENLRYALQNVQDFSHLWILFYFHKNHPEGHVSKSCKPKVAPPRLGGAKVGVFSTRSPHRPNPIGLSLARVDKVDVEQGLLYLKGIDLIEGTPIIDIKPYIPSYDIPSGHDLSICTDSDVIFGSSGCKVQVPEWITSSSNCLSVCFTERAMRSLKEFSPESDEFPLKELKSWKHLETAVRDILAADPRSVYRKKKCQDLLYFVTIDGVHFTVWFDNDIAEVLKVQPAVTEQ